MPISPFRRKKLRKRNEEMWEKYNSQDITQEELGEEYGLTKEHISNIFSEFREEKNDVPPVE